MARAEELCAQRLSAHSTQDLASVLRPMEKEKNPKANPNGFAYARAALGLKLELSFCAINKLAYSTSGHVRIEHNNYYSVFFLFFYKI